MADVRAIMAHSVQLGLVLSMMTKINLYDSLGKYAQKYIIKIHLRYISEEKPFII
jgi:hypothetical protein